MGKSIRPWLSVNFRSKTNSIFFLSPCAREREKFPSFILHSWHEKSIIFKPQITWLAQKMWFDFRCFPLQLNSIYIRLSLNWAGLNLMPFSFKMPTPCNEQKKVILPNLQNWKKAAHGFFALCKLSSQWDFTTHLGNLWEMPIFSFVIFREKMKKLAWHGRWSSITQTS